MLHFWKQNRLLPLPTYSPRNAECKIRSSLKRFSKNLWALGTPLFTNSDSFLDAQILLDGTLWVSSHDDDWGVKKSKNQLKFIKLAKVKLEFEFSLTTEDQALSLWIENTDSRSLDYQRTNPKEYQIVRTYTKETLEYKTWHHPTISSTLCRTPHLNNKQSKNTNPVISRQDYYLTQPCPSKEKQTENSTKSHPIQSLHKPLDQP